MKEKWWHYGKINNKQVDKKLWKLRKEVTKWKDKNREKVNLVRRQYEMEGRRKDGMKERKKNVLYNSVSKF